VFARKIDLMPVEARCAFVHHLDGDPIDRAMVEAINNIGHVMGIKTIAECVETEAVAEQLCSMGVDYALGYWIGRPEPMNRS
jgi:EAL domain-containing protein (putative c-di-GMP-specific phosphodiesterase class I)